MKALMQGLQSLGRALMLPIAVLPAAGLLLRLGQPDLLDVAFVAAAGEAIFSNLGLLFAIGVATQLARDGNGAASLAAVVCYLVARNGAQPLMIVPPDVTGDLAIAAWKAKAIGRLDVPIGILSGVAGGLLYNRFATIRLPDYLAFFGGRRFVPIVSGVAGIAIAAVLGSGYGAIAAGIDRLSWAIAAAGPAGLFLYGVVNRLLLVTGLHHILNNIVWFVLGDYHGVSGDLRRFFAGDPAAGAFMTGFFPVMMFGLPAACLAMYHEARPDRRRAVGGMLLSLALTSLLTGVTEPIEFSFMFLAPALYVLHAVLTGVSMAVTYALGMRLGFGFSAGLLDYVLNAGKATRPLLLLPIGLAYAAIYYGAFRLAIRRWNLATPGREADGGGGDAAAMVADGDRGAAFVAALGGAANLMTVGACTTRLRLVLADTAAADDARLKALGARGVLRPSPTTLQVVLGPIADQVADEIRVAAGTAGAPAPMVAPAEPRAQDLPAAVLAALGGAANLGEHHRYRGRIVVTLHDDARIDRAALAGAGVHMAAPVGGRWHLLTDPRAA
ncbi:N-acetylglucosamine-specific PTS transporter subunit IIBC [Sphingomonas sp.]|uniref:N-acetylglucosamine-specific PTS transporter subunit IIBC n=1 Tax=Sphingomonas sp. TaxID=28214 RepID=UPI00257BD402|nr:N-acetylglucosamine-specific PTS transporter subunit IIBC [Sphingomonas sp.]